MRVLHITHLYPTREDPRMGGVVQSQVQALLALGCASRVVSPVGWAPFPLPILSQHWRAYGASLRSEDVRGVKVVRPRYLAFPRAVFFAQAGEFMYWGLRKEVDQLKQDFPFDLIHAHMGLPDGHAGLRLSYVCGKPLVVTLRGTDVDISARRNRSCWLRLNEVIRGARRVVTPSPRLGYAVRREFGVDATVICNGINLEEVITGPSALRTQYESRRVILSASRLIESKGLDLNLQALKRLVGTHRDLLYLIIGAGPEERRLKSLTAQLGLSEHVQFLGELPHSKVMEFMAACDIFVLPSWQETFGLVYLEALAHGKPVIACLGQGVDGVIEQGQTGLLVTPRDVDSLVAALGYLLDNQVEARRMAEEGQKMVFRAYSWERNAAQTLALYQEVVNEN